MIRALPYSLLIAIAAATAAAQHSPAVDQRGIVAPQSNEIEAQPGDVLLSNLRQQPVYESQNKAVGEIDDILIDERGQVRAVLVDIGRGATPRLVAVPIASLEIRKGPTAGPATRTVQVFLRGGVAEIEKAPAFRAFREN